MPDTNRDEPWRLRIRFGKQGALRYTGHLDLHKLWERTIRRARLPLLYSHGFHPQPKIQIASALPLGYASRAELIDIWLEKTSEQLDLPAIKVTLQKAAPPGLEIYRIETAALRGRALQTLVRSAEYEATLLDLADEQAVSGRLAALLGAESLPRERRSKAYDLRPLIEGLQLTSPDEEGHPRLYLRLTNLEGATGRVEEVLDEMQIPPESVRIVRTDLIFEED
ncbi:MAG: DUF2344 domain-containing protein [Anaerolineales bacterium]|nr:DUF2344 domain-containing protein [Anaerolineales bacterium]